MMAGCRKSFTRVLLQADNHSAHGRLNRTISRTRKISKCEMGKGGGKRETWHWTHATSQVPLRIKSRPAFILESNIAITTTSAGLGIVPREF